MAMPRKQDPCKFCLSCGTKLERKRFSSGVLEDLSVFKRRKYCDRKCMSKAFKEKPKKSNPNWMTAHYHARNLMPKTHCSVCGSHQNLDIHHIDRNWRNNSLENLICLCRSCHIKTHRTKMP